MSHQKFAVVGLSCRMPGNSNTPQEFFDNLKSRRDCIVHIPTERFNADYYNSFHEKHPARIVSNRGGLMDHFYEFDRKAFKISKKEALIQDVQQKILLETTLHALEDSNINYRGENIGVFVGSTATGVIKKNMNHPYYMNEYCATGTGPSIHANLLSYKFDLRGPSFEVDTACSSSGAAMYIACGSLANKNCDAAVVGGIQIMLDHSSVIAFGRLGVLNTDGSCKSFDAKADGFVRSEGCGVAIVKRLEDAERDGDHIYCVLHCTTSNSDGGLTTSLTTPSGAAQSVALDDCLKRSSIDPKDIFFLEAHCTGTKVGDPAEINGAGSILGPGRDKDDFLRVGSVKGNIGHTECSAYIAGLLKICMMYQNSTLLPNVNYSEPNPKIKFDEYNLRVQLECEEFDPVGKKMVLNSFGFGGANVCTVTEGYDNAALRRRRLEMKMEKKKEEEEEEESEGEKEEGKYWKKFPGPHMFLVYGRTKEGLQNRIQSLKEFSEKEMKGDQLRLMYHLNTRRQQHYDWKSYGIGESFEKAMFQDPIRKPDQKEKIVFVFSGQGPQNIGMGRKLYRLFPAFRETIDYCNTYYKKISGVDVIQDIGIFGDAVGTQEELNKIQNTLPSIIFIQLALFNMWKSLGVYPDAVMGHSFGEMCASYSTGAVTIETILDIAFSRVKIVSQMKEVGRMIAVGASRQAVMDIIEENKLEKIWIAANNSPISVTAGGIPASVEKLKELCSSKGIFNRILNIQNAFHTPLICDVVELAMKLFGDSVRDIKQGTIPLISTTYPSVVWEGLLTPEYFWDNIKNCVRFREAIEKAMEVYGEDTIFLELSPHPVLSYSMKQCGSKRVVGTINRRKEELSSFLMNIGLLASYGYDVNWDVICRGVDKENIILNTPTYPFDRQMLNEEHEFFKRARLVDEREEMPPMLGRLQHTVIESWENFISTKTYPWLADHVVQNTVIFPAACYTEMFLELDEKSSSLKDVKFLTSMTVPVDVGYALINTQREGDKMTIYSKREGNGEKWVLQAFATLNKMDEDEMEVKKRMPESIESFKKRLSYRQFNHKEVYERLDEINLHYGETFANIEECYQGDEESLCIIKTDKLPIGNYIVHPSVLDSTYHAAIGTIRTVVETFIPDSIDVLTVYAKSYPKTAYVYCRLLEKTSEFFKGDIFMFDEDGVILVEIQGFVCTILKGKMYPPKNHYRFHWQTKELSPVKLPPTVKKPDPKWSNVLKHYDSVDEYICRILDEGLVKLKHFEDEEYSRERKRYFKWAEDFLERKKYLMDLPDDKLIPIDDIEGFELETDILKRVGDNWLDLQLNRNNEIRSVMFGDDLLDRFYYQSVTCEPVVSEFCRVFNEFIHQLVVERKRVVRILEVGSGTGAVARNLLPVLKEYSGMVEYYYTDLSTGFFPEAQKRFKEYPFIRFKAIDASRSFREQGIDDHSLDAVIAFDVLHAVDLIKGCVENVQKSLAIGGYLYLLEITNRTHNCLSHLDFCFGIFQGWHYYKDFRKHCSISRDEWRQLLEELNFGEIEYFGRDEEVHTMIAAKKVRSFEEKHLENVEIFDKLDPWGLVEMAKSFVGKPLDLIVCLKNSKMNPEWGEVYGVAKTLILECPEWNTKILDFADDVSEEEKKKWIQLVTEYPSKFEDNNLIKDGKIHCPRIIEIDDLLTPQQDFVQDRPYRLEVVNDVVDGVPQKVASGEINISYHEYNLPILKGTEMLIEVRYSSLNFKDVLLAMNVFSDLEPILGTDFSGVVVDVGPDVRKYKIGDEVFGLSKYTFASHCLTLEAVVARKPTNITHRDACSIPTVFLTAYIGLILNAKIEEGEKVLIHSASGGIGQAAIQLVQWKKGVVYATVGREEKRKYLNAKYGVSVFADSHSEGWDKELEGQFINGWEARHRPDVVLNSLKGENIDRGVKILAPFGRFVEIGKQDIVQKNRISLDGFMENLSFFSVHLDTLGVRPKGQVVISKAMEKISDLFADGTLKPYVEKEYPSDYVADAMKFIQMNEHLGKVVVKTDDVPKEIRVSNKLFSGSRTYVLSGGLGAVGFELMRYMCDLGANYVVLLSRSGRTTKYQERIMNELNTKQNKHILVAKCDVTSEMSTLGMYERIEKEHGFPNVGGVIHLAMVLQDISLEKISRRVYDRVVRPKKIGALNLMKPFTKPTDLEFAIFFSSVSSVVGNPGQINYVAGNCFCESFARKLRSEGFRIHVISLGAIVDVGLIAEQVMLRRIMRQNLIMEDPMTVGQTCWAIKNILKGEAKYIQHIPRFNFEGATSKLEKMKKQCSHLFCFKEESEEKGDDKAMTYESLNATIKKLLMLDEDVDPDERLTNYGVDSLQSIELASILSEKFGLEGISQMEILSGITINQLLKE